MKTLYLFLTESLDHSLHCIDKKHYKIFGKVKSFSYIYIINNKTNKTMISLESNKVQLKCHTPFFLDCEDGINITVLLGDVIEVFEHSEDGGDTVFEIVHGWMKGLIIPFSNEQLAKHFRL